MVHGGEGRSRLCADAAEPGVKAPCAARPVGGPCVCRLNALQRGVPAPPPSLDLTTACARPPEQKLLDTLENEVDSGNANLKRETERTKIVTRDAKTCWLYVVICLCLGVLILLVALRWW